MVIRPLRLRAKGKLGDLLLRFGIMMLFSVWIAHANSLFGAGASFTDPNLEAVVRETLSVFDRDLTQADLEKLVFLDGMRRDIRSLDGLEWASNLEDIDLRFNSISEVVIPKTWSRVSSLKLQRNGLNKLAIDGSIPSLRWLEAGENEISDLSFLQNAPGLFFLDLSYNDLIRFNLESDLPDLERLDLGYNQISDLSFLSRMPRVRSLILDDNGITRFELPNVLPELRTLMLPVNRIADLSFLNGLPNLENLDLASNLATAFHFPAGASRLKWLNLGENRLTNVTFAPAMSRLEWLGLDDNKLTVLPDISQLVGLRVLDLSINQLQEITIPHTLTNLTELRTRLNPLRLVRLPETLATNQLASTVEQLRNSGVIVEVYPAPAPEASLSIGFDSQQNLQLVLRGPPGFYEIWRSEDLGIWELDGTIEHRTDETIRMLSAPVSWTFYLLRSR